MHYMWYGDGYLVGMHLLWWLFWLLLLMLFAGILFFGWGRAERRSNRQHETPHEILRRRLATGEISVAEYEERKKLLDQEPGSEQRPSS